jgi:hypothetical protein
MVAPQALVYQERALAAPLLVALPTSEPSDTPLIQTPGQPWSYLSPSDREHPQGYVVQPHIFSVRITPFMFNCTFRMRKLAAQPETSQNAPKGAVLNRNTAPFCAESL